MSDEAWTTLKVLFGEKKANQILLDAIRIAQQTIDAGEAWQCTYCGRVNRISSFVCEGCNATKQERLSVPQKIAKFFSDLV